MMVQKERPITTAPVPVGATFHIGADANGIYITTNEFAFNNGFRAAQIYAISKRTLAAGMPSVAVIEFDTADPAFLLDGNPGFTVWPATAPAANNARDLGRTEYFLSSVAVFNGGFNGNGTNFRSIKSDNRLRIWALSNTQSLDTSSPAVVLTHGVINVETYGVPPIPEQKAGDFPLGQCLNDDTIPTPFGVGCWTWLGFSKKPSGQEVEAKVLAGDSRMQQVVFAGGKLWSALNTRFSVGWQARFRQSPPETTGRPASFEAERYR